MTSYQCLFKDLDTELTISLYVNKALAMFVFDNNSLWVKDYLKLILVLLLIRFEHKETVSRAFQHPPS